MGITFYLIPSYRVPLSKYLRNIHEVVFPLQRSNGERDFWYNSDTDLEINMVCPL